MKISVVIPAYNEEDFLPLVFESLSKQTVKPFEIVVVDNNSKDKTAEIAEKNGARVVAEKKQGYAFACNAGFYAARGDIIVRSDSDYIHTKDWLEKFQRGFEKDADCIAMGGPTYPIEGGFFMRLFSCPAVLIYMYFLKFMGRGYLFPNMGVKKEAFLKIKGFNEHLTFGEDIDFARRLQKVGKVKLMPSIYVFASARRAEDLGLFNYVFRYNLENLLRVMFKKKVSIGLKIVRKKPNFKFREYNPNVYYYTWTLLILGVLLAISILSLTS